MTLSQGKSGTSRKREERLITHDRPVISSEAAPRVFGGGAQSRDLVLGMPAKASANARSPFDFAQGRLSTSHQLL
jgi:hypothetical protein